MAPPTTILVADPQPLAGEAIAGALARFPDFGLMPEQPNSGLDTLDLAIAESPSAVILDYWMADTEGPAITRLILHRRPETKIILLSWFHGAREVRNAVWAGASAFLPKSLAIDELADKVRASLSARKIVVTADLQEFADHAARRTDPRRASWHRLQTLSSRQIEVIHLLSVDLAQKEIAEQLQLSPSTVKNHVHNILSKTEAGTQRELIAMARACGLTRN